MKKPNINTAKIGAFLKEGKSWVIIIILAIALYFLLKVTGVIKTKEERDEKTREKETEQGAKEEVKKQPLSYPAFQYNTWADSIHNALRFTWIDDKPQVAEDILKRLKNNSDYAQLFLSYGKRQRYNLIGLPDGAPEDLTSTITREFSNSRKEKVNKYFASKGIIYRF